MQSKEVDGEKKLLGIEETEICYNSEFSKTGTKLVRTNIERFGLERTLETI